MRKIIFTNSQNEVVAVLPFSEDSLLDQGTVAGLLSNPSIVEVDVQSEATIGWKYIDGEATLNGN
jgi:hypothetical protein